MGSVHGPHAIKSILNFQNAQKCAFLIMVCFSLYHGVLMVTKPGGNLCKSLLSDGSAGPAGEWRPFGCMTHIYSTEDSSRCMKQLTAWDDSTRLYFVGDSRLLTLFHAFGKHLNKSYIPPNKQKDSNRLVDVLMLKNDHSTMCFFGHEEITTSLLSMVDNWNKIQKGILPNPSTESVNETTRGRKNASLDTSGAAAAAAACSSIPPTHLVLSLGTKTIERFNHSETGLLDYQKNLEDLAVALLSIKFTRTVWMLQDPVAEGLLSDERKLITNKEIDAYNAIAQHIMQNIPGVEIWRSNRLIAQRMGFPAVSWHCPTKQEPAAVTSTARGNTLTKNTTSATIEKNPSPVRCVDPPPLSDGFHVSDEAMARNVQVLLNLYCNNHMKFEDGTCCRSPEPITSVQMRCFVFIGVCLVTTLLCFIYDTVLRSRINLFVLSKRWFARRPCLWRRAAKPTPESDPGSDAASADPSAASTFDDFYELTCALSKFGLILIYFFICDRTVLFMKTNKGFTIMSFLLPLAYFLILGLFFSGPTEQTQLNHVDITREWKGWMQVYFLIYHFTGSYRVLPLFSFTRYLISAYLFLSGFGHFYYFWHRPLPGSILRQLLPIRFSLGELYATCQAWWQVFHRYLDVMFRMNFFVLGLCLVMNRDYLFYYFIPLVSFWFTVIVALMIVFPRVTSPPTVAGPSLSLSENVPTMGTDNQAVPVVAMHPGHLPPADETGLVEPRSLLPAMCLNMPAASSSVCLATSSLCIEAKSSPSTPRQLQRYESPASITGCALVRHSRVQSTSAMKVDVRGHHKALSVGALSDVRQLTEPTSLPRNPRSAWSKLQTTGSRSGPPWPEDWFQKLRSLRVSTSRDKSRLRAATATAKSSLTHTACSRRCLCCRLRLADILIVVKLGCLVVAIELLNRSTEWFNAVFFSGPQRHLFELTSAAPNPMEPYGDEGVPVNFWRRRWSLDRYSVLYGMLFALVCEWARRVGWLTDSSTCDLGLLTAPPPSDHPGFFAYSGDGGGVGGGCCCGNLQPEPRDTEPLRFLPKPMTVTVGSSSPADSPDFPTGPFRSLGQGYGVFSKITCRRFTALSLTGFGLLGIGISILIAFRCQDRILCAQAHAFLCLIPILSYILVRNCLGVLRRTHSILFAWVGDISLELFVAQHHIWLSADGNGILVLLPGYPLLNLALTSFVFVCVCHEMHQLTRRLRRFIVPSGVVQAVRNLLLIGVVLHGITHSSWRLSG